MAFKTYDHSQNYTAQVIKLPVKQPVQGLDNLVEVNVFGNSCLISKDSDENSLYLFFPAGSQLSEKFIYVNNLYREFQLNGDPNVKGFFEVNRRVKAIKFRGIISTGFVIPIDSLVGVVSPSSNVNITYDLKPGDSFNEVDGVEVCRKYFVAIPPQSQGKNNANKINNKLANLLISNQFRFHNETSHLANNLHVLNPHDIFVVTDKWHGSSCILSKVLIVKKLNKFQKFFKAGLKLLLNAEIKDKEYGYIYSSGKPKSNLPKGIEGEWINDGIDYYTTNIWKRAFDDYKHALEDGISIYGELVGFTEGGQYIQKGYDYGCCDKAVKVLADGRCGCSVADPCKLGKVGMTERCKKEELSPQYRFIVYRITYTKPDGSVIEFSWQQIKEYCKKYGLEHAHQLYFGSLKHWIKDYVEGWSDNEKFLTTLQKMYNLEQKCTHCSTGVPAEGITLRVDGKQSYSTYKLKSKLFLKKESDDLDKGETNIEDNA